MSNLADSRVQEVSLLIGEVLEWRVIIGEQDAIYDYLFLAIL